MSEIKVNVGRTERWVSGLAGAGLIMNAIERPSAMNTLLSFLGIALLRRAALGHCPAYEALGIDTDVARTAAAGFTYGRGKRADRTGQRPIEDPSALSFPASDPPAHGSHSVGAPAPTI